jgi:hypothetical protein
MRAHHSFPSSVLLQFLNDLLIKLLSVHHHLTLFVLMILLSVYACIYQVIDDHTDINYQVAKEVGGGIVSSRDFVVLRHWGMKDNCYVSAGVSVKHPSVPPVKQYVRYVVCIAS